MHISNNLQKIVKCFSTSNALIYTFLYYVDRIIILWAKCRRSRFLSIACIYCFLIADKLVLVGENWGILVKFAATSYLIVLLTFQRDCSILLVLLYYIFIELKTTLHTAVILNVIAYVFQIERRSITFIFSCILRFNEFHYRFDVNFINILY